MDRNIIAGAMLAPVVLVAIVLGLSVVSPMATSVDTVTGEVNTAVPITSGTSVTVWEQTGEITAYSYLVESVLAGGASFWTLAQISEIYYLSSDGDSLTISCYRDPPTYLPSYGPGGNIVAARLDGVPDYPDGLWATTIVGYSLGENGNAESIWNALGDVSWAGPYTDGYSTLLGDYSSEIVLGFTTEPLDQWPHITQLASVPETYAMVGETATWTATAWDQESGGEDGFGLDFYWDWGDGTTTTNHLATEDGVPVDDVQSHSWSAVGIYEVSVKVWDGDGSPDDIVNTATKTVEYTVLDEAPSSGSHSYVWYDMFNVPFGEWWDVRWQMYPYWEPVTDTYPYLYNYYEFEDSARIYSNSRLNIQGESLSEINMAERPLFLPYLGTERGGSATINWYMQYMTSEELAGTPYEMLNDGFVVSLTGDVILDPMAAMSVLGITADELEDFDSWWATNESVVEDGIIGWMLSEGNDRLDIFNMYEYPYASFLFDLSAEEAFGNVTLHYNHVSWGMECLMARWLKDAFMPGEWFYEDFSLHAVIGPESTDINIDTAVEGSLFAYTSNFDGQPVWVWQGLYGDLMPSSYWHPYSSIDPYWGLTYLSRYPGSGSFGAMIPYDFAPSSFNLGPEDLMTFEWPISEVLFFEHEGPGAATELVSGMTVNYSEPAGYDLPANVEVDYFNNRLTFSGPLDLEAWSAGQTTHTWLESEWDRLGLLPYGLPWVEFCMVATYVYSPPWAEFTYSPTPGLVGEPIYFDASGSFDLDGAISQYMWDFGDGTYGEGVCTSHAYSSVGEYLVVLTVIDDSGLSGQKMVYVPVSSIPTAYFEFSPETPKVNELVSFFAYGSSGAAEIVGCYWDFGDGAVDSGWEVQHAYMMPGAFTVTLTVVDMYGAAGTSSKVIDVRAYAYCIRGTVVDSDGDPIRNAVVKLFRDGVLLQEVRTCANGGFEFLKLTPALYQLVISKSGCVPTELWVSFEGIGVDLGYVTLLAKNEV